MDFDALYFARIFMKWQHSPFKGLAKGWKFSFAKSQNLRTFHSNWSCTHAMNNRSPKQQCHVWVFFIHRQAWGNYFSVRNSLTLLHHLCWFTREEKLLLFSLEQLSKFFTNDLRYPFLVRIHKSLHRFVCLYFLYFEF